MRTFGITLLAVAVQAQNDFGVYRQLAQNLEAASNPSVYAPHGSYQSHGYPTQGYPSHGGHYESGHQGTHEYPSIYSPHYIQPSQSYHHQYYLSSELEDNEAMDNRYSVMTPPPLPDGQTRAVREPALPVKPREWQEEEKPKEPIEYPLPSPHTMVEEQEEPEVSDEPYEHIPKLTSKASKTKKKQTPLQTTQPEVEPRMPERPVAVQEPEQDYVEQSQEPEPQYYQRSPQVQAQPELQQPQPQWPPVQESYPVSQHVAKPQAQPQPKPSEQRADAMHHQEGQEDNAEAANSRGMPLSMLPQVHQPGFMPPIHATAATPDVTYPHMRQAYHVPKSLMPLVGYQDRPVVSFEDPYYQGPDLNFNSKFGQLEGPPGLPGEDYFESYPTPGGDVPLFMGQYPMQGTAGKGIPGLEQPTQITRRYVSPQSFPEGRDFGQFTPEMVGVQAAMRMAQQQDQYRQAAFQQATKEEIHQHSYPAPPTGLSDLTPQSLTALRQTTYPDLAILSQMSPEMAELGALGGMPAGFPMYGSYGMAVPARSDPFSNPMGLIGQAPGQFPPVYDSKMAKKEAKFRKEYNKNLSKQQTSLLGGETASDFDFDFNGKKKYKNGSEMLRSSGAQMMSNQASNQLQLTGDQFVTLDWHPDASGKPQHPTQMDTLKASREAERRREEEEDAVIQHQQDQSKKAAEELEKEIEEQVKSEKDQKKKQKELKKLREKVLVEKLAAEQYGDEFPDEFDDPFDSGEFDDFDYDDEDDLYDYDDEYDWRHDPFGDGITESDGDIFDRQDEAIREITHPSKIPVPVKDSANTKTKSVSKPSPEPLAAAMPPPQPTEPIKSSKAMPVQQKKDKEAQVSDDESESSVGFTDSEDEQDPLDEFKRFQEFQQKELMYGMDTQTPLTKPYDDFYYDGQYYQMQKKEVTKDPTDPGDDDLMDPWAWNSLDNAHQNDLMDKFKGGKAGSPGKSKQDHQARNYETQHHGGYYDPTKHYESHPVQSAPYHQRLQGFHHEELEWPSQHHHDAGDGFMLTGGPHHEQHEHIPHHRHHDDTQEWEHFQKTHSKHTVPHGDVPHVMKEHLHVATPHDKAPHKHSLQDLHEMYPEHEQPHHHTSHHMPGQHFVGHHITDHPFIEPHPIDHHDVPHYDSHGKNGKRQLYEHWLGDFQHDIQAEFEMSQRRSHHAARPYWEDHYTDKHDVDHSYGNYQRDMVDDAYVQEQMISSPHLHHKVDTFGKPFAETESRPKTDDFDNFNWLKYQDAAEQQHAKKHKLHSHHHLTPTEQQPSVPLPSARGPSFKAEAPPAGKLPPSPREPKQVQQPAREEPKQKASRDVKPQAQAPLPVQDVKPEKKQREVKPAKPQQAPREEQHLTMFQRPSATEADRRMVDEDAMAALFGSSTASSYPTDIVTPEHDDKTHDPVSTIEYEAEQAEMEVQELMEAARKAQAEADKAFAMAQAARDKKKKSLDKPKSVEADGFAPHVSSHHLEPVHITPVTKKSTGSKAKRSTDKRQDGLQYHDWEEDMPVYPKEHHIFWDVRNGYDIVYDPHYASDYDHDGRVHEHLMSHDRHYHDFDHQVHENYVMPDKYYFDHYEHDYHHLPHEKHHYWDQNLSPADQSAMHRQLSALTNLKDIDDQLAVEPVDFSDDEMDQQTTTSRKGKSRRSSRGKRSNDLGMNEVFENETPLYVRHHIEEPLMLEPMDDPDSPPPITNHRVQFTQQPQHHHHHNHLL